MAVVFDSSTPSYSASASQLSFAHTCSGSDRVLLVYAFGGHGGQDPIGVTYNGVALTQYITFDSNASKLYYLIAPASGSNTVIVDFAAADEVLAIAFSANSVDQTTPLGPAATAFSRILSVASDANELAVIFTGDDGASGTISGDLAQASKVEQGGLVALAHYADGASPTVTGTATIAGENLARSVGVSLLPSVATGPNVSTFNVDLSEKAGFQTLQVKIADADTANNGLFASDVITVEDDMQVTVETVKDGVTINLSSDGNISVDKTELDNAGGSITLNPEYFSPGTGNISTLPYTFTAPVEPGLSPVISGPETPNAIELSPLSLGYTITNRNGEAPTLTGVDAALFSIANTGGDNYSLTKLTNTGAVGTTYNVTINIDNLSEPAVTLPITITCIAATASTGMNKLGIKIGIGL